MSSKYLPTVNDIFQSNGDLENDERIGGIIVKMLRTAHKQELGLNDEKDGFQRMTSKSTPTYNGLYNMTDGYWFCLQSIIQIIATLSASPIKGFT